MRLSSLENAYSRPFLSAAILTRQVGQSDLVLTCYQGSLVGLCVQDCKFLCAAVAICSTVDNIPQTHIHTQRQHLTSLYEKLSQIS